MEILHSGGGAGCSVHRITRLQSGMDAAGRDSDRSGTNACQCTEHCRTGVAQLPDDEILDYAVAVCDTETTVRAKREEMQKYMVM